MARTPVRASWVYPFRSTRMSTSRDLIRSAIWSSPCGLASTKRSKAASTRRRMSELSFGPTETPVIWKRDLS